MAGEGIIIRGEVKAYEDITLAGRVEGDIVAPRVTIIDRARFDGRIDMPARIAAAPRAA